MNRTLEETGIFSSFSFCDFVGLVCEKGEKKKKKKRKKKERRRNEQGDSSNNLL